LYDELPPFIPIVYGKATVTNSFMLAGASEEDKHIELELIEVIANPDPKLPS
jgi:hypothetical protein